MSTFHRVWISSLIWFKTETIVSHKIISDKKTYWVRVILRPLIYVRTYTSSAYSTQLACILREETFGSRKLWIALQTQIIFKMNYNSTANQGYGIPVGGHRNQPVDKEPVTAALVAIVILGTGLVLILLCCYICVLRRLCCPDWGRKGTHHPRSTTTQQTSCDITKFDTLTAERSPS